MKIGIIVQRYGREINGGAEYHARLIAEKMAKHVDVEVFTSTALDYVTWKHHYQAGQDIVNGIPVNRFKVKKERSPEVFGRIQEKIFNHEHKFEDELLWLEEEGPYVPDLLDELENRDKEFDYFLFFSFRYYHSYHGVKRFGKKAVLVPTAEHDEVVYLRIFKDFFNLPGGIVFNSHEEKEILENSVGGINVPGDIVGVGSEIPSEYDAEAFRKKYNIEGKYFIYIGRLDENKGIPELFNHFVRFQETHNQDIKLVLMGKSMVEIPEHDSIVYLGFVDDEDKFNGLAGSEFLVIPSQFESLSMVALEAWAIGRPVLANGRTEVLMGQCGRSNGGLWYTNYPEFEEVMLLMLNNQNLMEEMGKNGISFFENNYAWNVIEDKYLGLFEKMGNSRS